MPKKIDTVHKLLESKRFQKATNFRKYSEEEIYEIEQLFNYIIEHYTLQNSYSILEPLVLYDVKNLVERFKFLKANHTARTRKSYIARYGKDEGNKRWASYCEKQRVKNLFETKQQKYGWSREEFDHFNKSRAITKDLCVKRHGEKKGAEIWENYIARQQYTNSVEYFQEKYGKQIGKQKWLEYNKEKAKSSSIEWIMEKYNVTHNNALQIASDRFSTSHVSNAEFDFVQILEESLGRTIKYTARTKQFSIWNEYTQSICFYDVTDTETMKIIEFHGDYWHCNPAKYDSNFNHPHSSLTAKEIWAKDFMKRKAAMDRGFSVKTVWWSDFINNQEKTIKESVAWLQQK